MNLRKKAILLLSVCLVFSILIPIKTKNPITQTVSTPYIVGFEGIGNPLNLTSRASIYTYVDANPGAYLRQICSALDISIGSAQYHLNRLVEGDLLESEKESKYKRFYVSRRFNELEKLLISLMNRPTTRIIIELVVIGGVSHKRLIEETGVSSQAITWQVQRLVEKGVVYPMNGVKGTFYHPSDMLVETYNGLVQHGHQSYFNSI